VIAQVFRVSASSDCIDFDAQHGFKTGTAKGIREQARTSKQVDDTWLSGLHNAATPVSCNS
jgi:hypothetical protein